MPNLGGFLKGLGQQAGYNILYGQELQQQQDVHEQRQAALAGAKQQQEMNAQAMQEAQAQKEERAVAARELSQPFADAIGTAKGDAERAQRLGKVKISAIRTGDSATYALVDGMEKTAKNDAKESVAKALQLTKDKNENVSGAATGYLQNPGDPANATAFVKSLAEKGIVLPPEVVNNPTKLKAAAMQHQLEGKTQSEASELVLKMAADKLKQDQAQANSNREFSLHRQEVNSTLATQHAAQALSAEKLKMLKALGAPQDPNRVLSDAAKSDGAQLVAGRKLTEVVPGFGGQTAARREEAKTAALAQLKADNIGITAEQAGRLLDAAAIDRSAKLSGATAAARTAGTTLARTSIAADEAKKMIPLVMSLAAEVGSTDYPTMNAVVNAIQRGTGDPTIMALDASIGTFVNQYSRAVFGTGGGALADREHAHKRLYSALAQGQIKAVTDVMQKEMEYGIEAPVEYKARAETEYQKKSGVPTAPLTQALPAGWH